MVNERSVFEPLKFYCIMLTMRKLSLIFIGRERIERYVMEWMSNGDLSTYIKNNGESLEERNKKESLNMRLGFLLDVAQVNIITIHT